MDAENRQLSKGHVTILPPVPMLLLLLFAFAAVAEAEAEAAASTLAAPPLSTRLLLPNPLLGQVVRGAGAGLGLVRRMSHSMVWSSYSGLRAQSLRVGWMGGNGSLGRWFGGDRE